MNELVDLEGNKSACHFKFTFELAHNTLESFLGVVYQNVLIKAHLISIICLMMIMMMINSFTNVR